jgi:hypothetical protein
VKSTATKFLKAWVPNAKLECEQHHRVTLVAETICFVVVAFLEALALEFDVKGCASARKVIDWPVVGDERWNFKGKMRLLREAGGDEEEREEAEDEVLRTMMTDLCIAMPNSLLLKKLPEIWLGTFDSVLRVQLREEGTSIVSRTATDWKALPTVHTHTHSHTAHTLFWMPFLTHTPVHIYVFGCPLQRTHPHTHSYKYMSRR